MPAKKNLAPAFTNGDQASAKFLCEKYGCEISRRGCFLRQTAHRARGSSSAPSDFYCLSGECEQGREILAEAKKNPAAFKAPPRRRSEKSPARAMKRIDGRRKRPETPPGWNWCSRCKRAKKQTEFNRHGDGWQAECRQCQAARAKEYGEKRRRERAAVKRGKTLRGIVPLAEVRRRHARRVVKLAGGNVSKAAGALGVCRQTLNKILWENQPGA